MIDLYCLGGAAADVILEAPRLPRSGEKLFMTNSSQAAGGFIANSACAAARLGLETAWGGYVGNDAFGQIIQNDFQKFGVQIKDIDIQNKSDFTVVMITPDGERTILVVPVVPTPPPLTSKMKQSLKETRIAYTTLFEQNWFKEVANVVHSSEGIIAVDMEANTVKDIETTTTKLKLVDIVFTDEAGIAAFTGEKVSRKSVESVLNLGPELVVVTRGGKGAEAYTLKECFSTGIFDVKVKDTTGAGDCFHAAYLYGLLSDWDAQQCLEFAGAAAAILIQSIGARNGLPTSEEVRKFLKSN